MFKKWHTHLCMSIFCSNFVPEMNELLGSKPRKGFEHKLLTHEYIVQMA